MSTYVKPNEKAKWFTFPDDYASGLKRAEGYRWFKPILALVLGFIFYLIFGFTVEGIGNALSEIRAANMTDILPSGAIQGAYNDMDMTDPIQMASGYLQVIAFIPAIFLALKLTKLGPFGALSSCEGKFRWDRVKALLPWTFLVAIVMFGIESGITIATDGPGAFGDPVFMPLMLIIIIVLVPFQAAAEEYLFRGFVMQTFSSWIPIVLIPVILQSLCFAALHGYNLLGNSVIFISGLTYGYVAVKTGGIEAGTCMHTARNTLSFLSSAIFISQTTMTDVTVMVAATTLASTIVMLVVTLWVCKRKGFILADTPKEDKVELVADAAVAEIAPNENAEQATLGKHAMVAEEAIETAEAEEAMAE